MTIFFLTPPTNPVEAAASERFGFAEAINSYARSGRIDTANFDVLLQPGASTPNQTFVSDRITPDDLRWLTKSTQKGAARTVTVGKAGSLGDIINRATPFLHHKSRRLHAKVFNGFCR